jgi:hypothetical protein
MDVVQPAQHVVTAAGPHWPLGQGVSFGKCGVEQRCVDQTNLRLLLQGRVFLLANAVIGTVVKGPPMAAKDVCDPNASPKHSYASCGS